MPKKSFSQKVGLYFGWTGILGAGFAGGQYVEKVYSKPTALYLVG